MNYLQSGLIEAEKHALTNMKSRAINSRGSTNQIILSVLHENNG